MPEGGIQSAMDYNVCALRFAEECARYNSLMDNLESAKAKVQQLVDAVAQAQQERLPLEAQKARRRLNKYEAEHTSALERQIATAQRLHDVLTRTSRALEQYGLHDTAQHALFVA